MDQNSIDTVSRVSGAIYYNVAFAKTEENMGSCYRYGPVFCVENDLEIMKQDKPPIVYFFSPGIDAPIGSL